MNNLKVLKPAIAINLGVMAVTIGVMTLYDRRMELQINSLKYDIAQNTLETEKQMDRIMDKASGKNPE